MGLSPRPLPVESTAVTRRREFSPPQIDEAFWHRDQVRRALAQRDISSLLRAFLQDHPGCTQTRLAILIAHDRADVSNWVRGTRQPRVSDINVLARIADGLAMPDQARVTLGLAPAEAIITDFTMRPASTPSQSRSNPSSGSVIEVALCGSRSHDTANTLIDETVPALARMVMLQGWNVAHGPVGIGIEVMTYIADHYQPPSAPVALGRFGHRAVVQSSEYVIVIGGGRGTADEVDLAVAMRKKLVAFSATGGAARQVMNQSLSDIRLREWIPDSDFEALTNCVDPEEFVALVQNLLANDFGGTS